MAPLNQRPARHLNHSTPLLQKPTPLWKDAKDDENKKNEVKSGEYEE
jgi:hypothetical protein